MGYINSQADKDAQALIVESWEALRLKRLLEIKETLDCVFTTSGNIQDSQIETFIDKVEALSDITTMLLKHRKFHDDIVTGRRTKDHTP